MQRLHINTERLWASMMETAKIGGTNKGGLNRLTLSDGDRQVRDWFVRTCESIGCTVTVDDMGNIFARKQGKNSLLPPIAMGSHLDTQPAGGKFDGVIGVLSGLEVLHTLHDAGYTTNAPLEVINWTNEEGIRFSPPIVGSGVFAGAIERDTAYAGRDNAGKVFVEELKRIGYQGQSRCGDRKLGAYFELCIEEGLVQEADKNIIGVLTGIQGERWYEVMVTGRESHAGSTPMPVRRDAMLACARIVEMVNKIALDHAPSAVSTVGRVVVKPNSPNVIPGSVYFTVDLRHPDDEVSLLMDNQLRAIIREVKADMDIPIELNDVWNTPSTRFDETCVNIVRSSAESFKYQHRDIISGSGHDAGYISRVAPTAMIAIPCKDGISHNEMEEISPEQAAAGTNVLLQSILTWDNY
jgi:N-carbamoyl-L-amino-acid hydrolase